MELLTDDQIPALSGTLEVDDENVLIGTFDPGVVIHYVERDAALLIMWEDIVKVGGMFLDGLTSQELKAIEVKHERREIVHPGKKVIQK